MFNYQLYPGREKDIIEFENQEKPRITIVTAYYNGHKYIDQTINSVLNQSYNKLEIILIKLS